MSRAKELLEQATPLPWKPFADTRHEVEGRVGCVATAPDGATAVCYGTNGSDAALIVYAVNRLPDYEAAVEALDRIRQKMSDWQDATQAAGVYNATDPDTLMAKWVHDESLAALARLRDEVPA